MNHDERDQQLEADYRRASDADAGRPASATRVAILAEAAAGAAARRRATPAANESRYWLRAVAGLGVVGVGVLLWRQTDHQLPGEATVMVAETLQQEDAQTTADAGAAATAPVPSPQAPPAVASRRAVDADAATEADAANAANAAGAAENARELRAEEPAPVAESQQKAERERAAAPAAPFAAGAATEAEALLRQHFPTEYQSDSPHRLWLVRNAAGDVLQKGNLASDQSLADLAAQLASNPPDRRPGTWRTTPVPNARGQLIELSIGEIP